MKVRKMKKKLTLNKISIARLGDEQQKGIYGGELSVDIKTNLPGTSAPEPCETSTCTSAYTPRCPPGDALELTAIPGEYC